MVNKNYVVIAYDIRDDKRRASISQFLLARGWRVNYSVFECLVSKRELREVKARIGRMIVESEDRVIYYSLCQECLGSIERQGRGSDFSPSIVETI